VEVLGRALPRRRVGRDLVSGPDVLDLVDIVPAG
jgi:hypothetical protein